MGLKAVAKYKHKPCWQSWQVLEARLTGILGHKAPSYTTDHRRCTWVYRNITQAPSQITLVVQGAYVQLQNQIITVVSYGLELVNLTSDLQRFKIKPKTPSWHWYFLNMYLHIFRNVLSKSLVYVVMCTLCKNIDQKKISRAAL